MDWLDLVQWPAMIVTIVAAWFTASSREGRRNLGFWLFIVSNALWSTWGVYTGSWALVILQAGLFIMNVRGARANDAAPS